MYRKYPALYEFDNNWDGFEWMNADDADNSVYSFVRKSSKGKNNLLFVLNMTPVKREEYQVALPKAGKYKLLLNSDAECFGGNGVPVKEQFQAKKKEYHFHNYSATVDLPPYGALVYIFG